MSKIRKKDITPMQSFGRKKDSKIQVPAISAKFIDHNLFLPKNQSNSASHKANKDIQVRGSGGEKSGFNTSYPVQNSENMNLNDCTISNMSS